MTRFDDARVALREAVTATARLQGRRDVMASRLEDVRVRVADAKARLSVKDEVRAVLDKMQADAYDKVRGDYERVLTALVSDVLPSSPAIALDLYTERNQPALDIITTKPDGSKGDVYADHGGSLTNVVSTGLRLLAVVKSKGAKFAVLDESDCWIKTEHVPAFYAVVEDAAQRLGLQCFVISHHDVEAFDTDIRVSRLVGRPETGVSIECSARDPVWTDDQEGFRFVRIENFQSYRRAELILSPGVNALIGENDFGKSVVVRAFTAAFYGDTRDSLVRHGERSATVEFGWKNGRFLRFVRNLRGTPKNVWSYHERDGRVVDENGVHHMTGGKSPPEWVDRIFGIVRADGVDVHLPNQKTPTFLLDRPASTRASILSIGREADYVPDMLSIHKDDVTRDQNIVREGEKEYAALTQSLSRYDAIDEHADRLASLQEDARRIAQQGQINETDVDAYRRHTATAEALERQTRRSATVGDLPDTSYVAELSESVEWWSQSTHSASLHADLSHHRGVLRTLGACLDGLPAASPSLIAVEDGDRGRNELVSAQDRLTKTSRCKAVLADMAAAVPGQHDVATMEANATRHDDLKRARERACAGAAILRDIPSRSPDLNALEQSIAAASMHRSIAERQASLQQRKSILDAVPTAPSLTQVAVMTEAVDAHDRLRTAQSDLHRSADMVLGEMSDAQADLGLVMECLGHRCPTCGQPAEVEHLVDHTAMENHA